MQAEEAMVYQMLATTSAVTSKLATYRTKPAIFSDDAPSDAVMPWIIYNQVAGSPMDTMTEIGHEQLIDIKAYITPSGNDIAPLNAIIEAARAAVHRKRPTGVAGRHIAGTRVVAGPAELPRNDNAVGRFITLKVESQEV